MKLFLVLLFLGLPAVTRADETESSWNVRAELRMIAVPQRYAFRLTSELRRAETFATGEARVNALIASGGAEILGWPTLQCPNGYASTSESVEHVLYPTEFELLGIPGDFAFPTQDLILMSLRHRRFDVPTGFETRDCGPVLRIDPVVEPSGRIRLTVDARFTQLDSMEPGIGTRSDRLGDHLIYQPRFREFHVHTSLTVANGGGLLLDTFADERRARTVLFLLYASARRLIPPNP
jgi:hypothetical protein